jgi:hypothetical protein
MEDQEHEFLFLDGVKGKSEGKVHPRTDHEDPEGE